MILWRNLYLRNRYECKNIRRIGDLRATLNYPHGRTINANVEKCVLGSLAQGLTRFREFVISFGSGRCGSQKIIIDFSGNKLNIKLLW